MTTVTQEQFEQLQQENANVKVVCKELFDSEGTKVGEAAYKTPTANCISEFERLLDRNPLKSKETLINGTLLTDRDHWKSVQRNSEEFAALFLGAAEMIPAGKTSAKKF